MKNCLSLPAATQTSPGPVKCSSNSVCAAPGIVPGRAAGAVCPLMKDQISAWGFVLVSLLLLLLLVRFFFRDVLPVPIEPMQYACADVFWFRIKLAGGMVNYWIMFFIFTLFLGNGLRFLKFYVFQISTFIFVLISLVKYKKRPYNTAQTPFLLRARLNSASL